MVAGVPSLLTNDFVNIWASLIELFSVFTDTPSSDRHRFPRVMQRKSQKCSSWIQKGAFRAPSGA